MYFINNDIIYFKYLHVGAQTVHFIVREECWSLSGRNTERKTVHDFIFCFKNKLKCDEQNM